MAFELDVPSFIFISSTHFHVKRHFLKKMPNSPFELVIVEVDLIWNVLLSLVSFTFWDFQRCHCGTLDLKMEQYIQMARLFETIAFHIDAWPFCGMWNISTFQNSLSVRNLSCFLEKCGTEFLGLKIMDHWKCARIWVSFSQFHLVISLIRIVSYRWFRGSFAFVSVFYGYLFHLDALIQDKKLKEIFPTIPSLNDLQSLEADGINPDIIVVDAEKDKKIFMLKQLSGALVKGLNNPALVIKKIAGLVSYTTFYFSHVQFPIESLIGHSYYMILQYFDAYV